MSCKVSSFLSTVRYWLTDRREKPILQLIFLFISTNYDSPQERKISVSVA